MTQEQFRPRTEEIHREFAALDPSTNKDVQPLSAVTPGEMDVWQRQGDVNWGIPGSVPESSRQAIIDARLGELQRQSEVAQSTADETSSLPPVEAAQLNIEPKNFFSKRIDSLRGLWQRTKEATAKTAETLIKKPTRLIGAVAINGAFVTVQAGRALNGAVGEGVDVLVANARKIDQDIADGYDENTRWGKLKAKTQRRTHNPRPKQEVKKLSRDEQWLVDHKRKVEQRLGSS